MCKHTVSFRHGKAMRQPVATCGNARKLGNCHLISHDCQFLEKKLEGQKADCSTNTAGAEEAWKEWSRFQASGLFVCSCLVVFYPEIFKASNNQPVLVVSSNIQEPTNVLSAGWRSSGRDRH